MNAREYLKRYGPEQAEGLAKAAGTNLAYFRQLAYGASRASHKLATALEVHSGGVITRAELRPDIFCAPAEHPQTSRKRVASRPSGEAA